MDSLSPYLPLGRYTMIIGPTGIGKSAAAIELAHQHHAHTGIYPHIISSDAFQVYQGMDIGTGKVLPHEQHGIAHHLIDIQTPDTPYTVGEFMTHVTRLDATIPESIPLIFCGGSPLYSYAWLNQYSLAPAAQDPELKQQLANELDRDGNRALWERLHQQDPDAASAIHPNNRHRLIRALEIIRITGKKPSNTQRQPRTDVTVLGLSADWSQVRDRIAQRVSDMVAAGWLDEVRSLRTQYSPTAPGFRAIGYPAIIQALSQSPPIDLQRLIQTITTQTQQFAKRQRTWYRKFDASWIPVNNH